MQLMPELIFWNSETHRNSCHSLPWESQSTYSFSSKESSKFPILHSECVLPPAPFLSTTRWFPSRQHQTMALNKPIKLNRNETCNPLSQNQPKSTNKSAAWTRKSRTARFPKGFGSSLATWSGSWDLLQTQCPVDTPYDRESVTKQVVKYSFDQRKAAFDAGTHPLPSRISKSKVCKH